MSPKPHQPVSNAAWKVGRTSLVSYLVPWGEERERGRKRRTFIVLAHIRLVVHNSDSPNVARRLLRTSLHLGRHAALALLNVRLVGRCTVVHAVVGDAVV